MVGAVTARALLEDGLNNRLPDPGGGDVLGMPNPGERSLQFSYQFIPPLLNRAAERLPAPEARISLSIFTSAVGFTITVHGGHARIATGRAVAESQLNCDAKCSSPAYKTSPLIADRITVIFTDRFAHTQCFATGNSGEA